MSDVAQHDPLDAGRMTLWEHLAELRNRLVKMAIAIAVGAVAGWFLFFPVFDLLTNQYLKIYPNAKVIGTSLTDPFFLRLEVACYLGVIFAMPVLLWQIWRFVTPGLYPKEKKYAIPFVGAALILFVMGCALAYFILPAAIQFFLSVAGYGDTPAGTPQPGSIEIFATAESYLKLNLFMMLAFGIGFEFPIILVGLQVAGVLTPRKLNSWRRPAIVVIAVVAAVITPSGDPISMIALAVPMYIFYELSILIGWAVTRRKYKDERVAAKAAKARAKAEAKAKADASK